jgi:uncharacterized phage protein (TIGR02218 family)
MSVDFSTIEIEKFFPLYKIEHGNSTWYYTGADHSIAFDGHTYLAAPIQHGGFNKEDELSNYPLEINMPLSEVAQRFLATAPPQKVLVSIYLYQEVEDPQYFLAYQGEVIKVTIGQGNSCSVSLNEYTVMSTKLPKTLIQPACNHILFGSGSGLSCTDWKTSATVEGFYGDNKYIESTAFTLFPLQYFRQGTMEFEGDSRHISYHNGVLCSLQIPFPDLQIGDTVFLYPGCDKDPATCRDKFDNLDNYLGCPYVPRKNPVLYGL